MLSPAKEKFNKAHKGRIAGMSTSGTLVSFGDYGLKSLDPMRVNARQIEAARIAAVRFMKRQGKFWINIFPDVPVSKKPAEVRMGKGKGAREYYVVRVYPGKILFEIAGVPEDVAREAFRLASAKLPLTTKFVKRYE